MIFRAELGLYLGQLLLLEIVSKRLSITRLFKHGVPAGITLLGMDIVEPPHQETSNVGFRSGLTQTRLYSHRSRLETLIFRFKK